MFLIFFLGFNTGVQVYVCFPCILDLRDTGSDTEKGEQAGPSGEVDPGLDRITDEKAEGLGFVDETPPKECLLPIEGKGIETKTGGTGTGEAIGTGGIGTREAVTGETGEATLDTGEP